MKKLAIIALFSFSVAAAQIVENPQNTFRPRSAGRRNDFDDVNFPGPLPRIDGQQSVFPERPAITQPLPCGQGQSQLPCGPTVPSGQTPCEIVQPIFPVDSSFPKVEVVNPITDESFVPAEENEDRYCPSGTVAEGNVCVDRLTPNCPPNYAWKNDRCVATQTSCPLDYEYIGGSCVLRKICPEHHILQNGRCILPPTICPFGWTWNGVNCQTTEIYCEQGSVRKGNECVTTSFTCPPGYIENREGCSKPPIQCASGYVLSQSGFCISQSNVKRCSRGDLLENGKCRIVSMSCPKGSYQVNDKCYRDKVVEDLPETGSYHCPEGYTFRNNMCYKCPGQSNLCGSQCIHRNTPCTEHQQSSSPLNLNINLHTNNHGSSQPSSGKGYNIVNNIAGHNNTIVNVNNITNPVHLSNVNENNIHLYTNTKCRDGSIRTVMVKNNETINGCVDVTTDENSVEEEVPQKSKCCEIKAPRQCKQRNNGQWGCGHKRYKYCGKFCVADHLYLKPPSTSYANNVLTFAPHHSAPHYSRCAGRQCPPIDCGGCTNGSWDCSPECYTNQCSHGGCNYLNQEDFCETVGGNICQ